MCLFVGFCRRVVPRWPVRLRYATRSFQSFDVTLLTLCDIGDRDRDRDRRADDYERRYDSRSSGGGYLNRASGMTEARP